MSQLRMIWLGETPSATAPPSKCRVIDRTAKDFTKEQLADGWLYACAPLINETWDRTKFYEKIWNVSQYRSCPPVTVMRIL